jgi:hypothetical protein
MNSNTCSLLFRRLLIVSLLTVAIFGTRSANAQSLTEEINIDLDPVGDAVVTITDKYSASAWLQWKDSLGSQPDLVVRDKKRQFAAWEISDFAFSKDEVSRVAESKMKVRAYAQISKDGEYVLDRLPTGLHLVTTKGDEWIFAGRGGDDSDSDDTELTVRVKLPPGASNPHILNPDSSHTQLIYSATPRSSRVSRVLLLAVVLGVLGAVALSLAARLPESLDQMPQFLAIRKVLDPSALLGGGRWQLVGRTPEGDTLQVEITDSMFTSNDNRLVLGRTVELCHVVIDTKSVSKQHAQIRREGSTFKVADRNSSNGTAVNGQFSRAPFDEVPFKEGDTLTLGDVKLDFSSV